MELGERVNGSPVGWQNTSVFSPRPAPGEPLGGEMASGPAGKLSSGQKRPAAAPRPTAPDEGPCLYLGPKGERCERRALKGGFCAWHQPGAVRKKPAEGPSQLPKRLAAAIAIIAALWPFLMQFLHALARFFR